MAKLVAILATTHHPFFYRASTAPPESRPDFADEWVRKVTTYRETLTRARPDVLVMVGSDHFHQFFYDNMPQFLITIDRDPALVERYREDPRGTVIWWETERANVILNLTECERSTWQRFTDEEREALATHDYVKLFELGAHPFLTLTLFIALFERDYAEPLG